MKHALIWRLIGLGLLAACALILWGFGFKSSNAPTGWRSFYNRNAIQASVVSDDRFVALTAAGTLLSLDRATFQLKAEYTDKEVVRLGQGPNGMVLAGLDSGDIVQVDPKTLQQTAIGKVQEPVECVIAAFLKQEEAPRFLAVLYGEHLGLGKNDWQSTVVDVGSQRIHALGKRASTYMLDSKGILWLGENQAEWGGWCGYYDLESETFHTLDPGKERAVGSYGGGVYGFTELSDGRVLVFGGKRGMGALRSYVAEVSTGGLKKVFSSEDFPKKDLTQPGPVCPITHIVENPDSKMLYVFAYSEVFDWVVFETDKTFKEWKWIPFFKLRHHEHHPDATKCEPGITTVHFVDGHLVIATRCDGYMTLDEDKQTYHALPDRSSK